MDAETFYLEASDGERIAVHSWQPKSIPQAIIQISHGMAEYAMRYDRFAEAAVKRGFAVYAADHRGHGQTAGSLSRLGHLADANGFERVTEDQHELTLEIRRRIPGTPVILYGHSFGSFIAQRYIERYGRDIAACAMTGTRGPDPAIVQSGRLITRLVCLFSGSNKPSRLLTYMNFNACNKRIPHATSPNAWISRDPEEVERYDVSPWSGFTCTAGFYRDMLDGLSVIHKKSEMLLIPRDLPLLILIGEDDPIGKYGKTVRKLVKKYKSIGLTAVTAKEYPQGRHEPLNDLNRVEVTEDMLGWMAKRAVDRPTHSVENGRTHASPL